MPRHTTRISLKTFAGLLLVVTFTSCNGEHTHDDTPQESAGTEAAQTTTPAAAICCGVATCRGVAAGRSRRRRSPSRHTTNIPNRFDRQCKHRGRRCRRPPLTKPLFSRAFERLVAATRSAPASM